jgi:hypothetical protein
MDGGGLREDGRRDALSEYGTNSQYYLIPHVVEPLVRIELLPNERAWGVVPVLAEKWSFPTRARSWSTSGAV